MILPTEMIPLPAATCTSDGGHSCAAGSTYVITLASAIAADTKLTLVATALRNPQSEYISSAFKFETKYDYSGTLYLTDQ